MLECNICLEQAADPVVTKCGHLFCWSCLYEWIQQPRRSTVHGGLQPSTGNAVCPVCKAAVSAQAVTPIYSPGQSASGAQTPGMPPRPAAEWEEPVEPPPGISDALGNGTVSYGFAMGYGQFPVVCSLWLSGQRTTLVAALRGLPRRVRLVSVAATALLLASMAFM
eukprot:TRINITY_DN11426_c0_g1_i2.p1 TRINITY_DN11426_c0_g1~~TRINITY_DN11426_c0_g1_i2.p1  ORF type:complete len:166 (+),score=36.84 TRINITY_DN11426_c0_g1_i2:102-599(+)